MSWWGPRFFMLKSASNRECLRGISWVVLASSAKRILVDNFGLLGFWTLLERDIEFFITKLPSPWGWLWSFPPLKTEKKNRALWEFCLFLEKCGRYTLRKRSWWRAILLQTFFWEVFFKILVVHRSCRKRSWVRWAWLLFSQHKTFFSDSCCLGQRGDFEKKWFLGVWVGWWVVYEKSVGQGSFRQIFLFQR